MKKRKNFIIKSFCVTLTLIAFFGSIFCIQKIEPIKANANDLFYVTFDNEVTYQEETGVFENVTFVSDNISFQEFSISKDIESNNFKIYYDNVLVYDKVWLKQEYRVMGFESESYFINQFGWGSLQIGNNLQIGYNIPIKISGWYRFNASPSYSYSENEFKLNFNTYFTIPKTWQNANESTENQPEWKNRNNWNTLWVGNNEISYIFETNNGFRAIYDAYTNDEWNKNVDNISYLQTIFIKEQYVDYEIYLYLINNGYFGTTTELLINTENANNGITDMIFSLSTIPMNILQQVLDIQILGQNLFVVFCGIITIVLVVFVLKKVT